MRLQRSVIAHLNILHLFVWYIKIPILLVLCVTQFAGPWMLPGLIGLLLSVHCCSGEYFTCIEGVVCPWRKRRRFLRYLRVRSVQFYVENETIQAMYNVKFFATIHWQLENKKIMFGLLHQWSCGELKSSKGLSKSSNRNKMPPRGTMKVLKQSNLKFTCKLPYYFTEIKRWAGTCKKWKSLSSKEGHFVHSDETQFVVVTNYKVGSHFANVICCCRWNYLGANVIGIYQVFVRN